jgi:CRISPR/Cas system CSM-associated protein Csm3 (group 7 of RAMP superfamily)
MSYRDRDPDRPGGQPPLPKPYEFVPLPQGRIPTAPPAGHHRYRQNSYTGVLTTIVVARSPVHVASGLLEPTSDRQYPLVKGHFRTKGQLAIPGTSLKGCIRSIAEAISRSSVQVSRSRDLPRDYQPSEVRERDRREQNVQLDVAQRIFGALGYQGMVRFADAVLVEGRAMIVPSVQLFRPRAEAHDTYFDGRQPRGRKFYMHGALAQGNLPLEACAEGSRFALRMEFENLSAAELGLVLTALGLGEPRLWPKLGGAKPACLGTIEMTGPILAGFAGAAAYADFDAAPQPLEIAPLIQAARDARLLLNEQLGRLAEVLRWPREDRECPDRSY